MAVLFRNLCYNKVCYKGIALYMVQSVLVAVGVAMRPSSSVNAKLFYQL